MRSKTIIIPKNLINLLLEFREISLAYCKPYRVPAVFRCALCRYYRPGCEAKCTRRHDQRKCMRWFVCQLVIERCLCQKVGISSTKTALRLIIREHFMVSKCHLEGGLVHSMQTYTHIHIVTHTPTRHQSRLDRRS